MKPGRWKRSTRGIKWTCGVMVCGLLVLACAGCEPTPVEQAKAYVAQWPEMANDRGRLPKDQGPFFEENLTEVAPVLRAALSDERESVRQRAAYVISEIGPAAMQFETDLRAHVDIEPLRLVRMYLYEALAAIGAQDEATLATLRRRFEELEAIAAPDDEHYSNVEERISVAGTLFVLEADHERRAAYEAFVIRYLDPEAEGATAESQWVAITALADMPGATSAKEPLEALLAGEDQPAWIGPKVRRALVGIGGR